MPLILFIMLDIGRCVGGSIRGLPPPKKLAPSSKATLRGEVWIWAGDLVKKPGMSKDCKDLLIDLELQNGKDWFVMVHVSVLILL